MKIFSSSLKLSHSLAKPIFLLKIVRNNFKSVIMKHGCCIVVYFFYGRTAKNSLTVGWKNFSILYQTDYGMVWYGMVWYGMVRWDEVRKRVDEIVNKEIQWYWLWDILIFLFYLFIILIRQTKIFQMRK